MASENGWIEYSLEEVTENLDSVRVPVKRADRRSGPYPYYGASGIVDYVDNYIFDGEYLLVAEDGENLRTRNTPIAFIATGRFWVNNHAHIVRGNHLANTRYLAYALDRTNISGYLSGTTMPKLTQGNLNQVRLSLPPRPIQDEIVALAKALDDKIELNRRMNETLEAMARAIFKSWFVDFDPVRTKLDGRQLPGMDADTAALFPDRFDHIDVGLIPLGWRRLTLDQITEFVIGGDWGKEQPADQFTEAAHCIRGADIPGLQSGGDAKMPVRFLKPQSLAKRSLRDGDLVFEISGGSPTQSTGRPVLVTETIQKRFKLPLVCSNFCRLIRPANTVSSKFVYLWLRWLYDCDEFLQYENGTTGIKNLAFKVFSSLHEVIVPPEPLQTTFDQAIAPMLIRREANAIESISLSVTRDALLPKLLSGEIRVSEAEKVVEGVVR